MATTPTPADLHEIRYRRQFWREYVRKSGFMPYMGTSPETVIQLCYEATKSGKSITIPLVSRLKGSGVEGSARLSGAEEALGKHTHSITVKFRRNAVELDKEQQHYDFSASREAVRPSLKEWSASKMRDDIIDALGSVGSSGVQVKTLHATPNNAARNIAATSGEANTWLTANSDRVLFGAAIANQVAGNFASSLLNIDNSADKFTASTLRLMKYMAKHADPHIRPCSVDDGSGREYFKVFANSLAFRDFASDSEVTAANRDARAREANGWKDNPLFQGGDLVLDGCIVREIPEIPFMPGVGADGIQAGWVALCGAQAVSIGYGQEPRFTKKNEDDYGFFEGIGIEEMLGINKVQRKDGVTGDFIDNGVVLGFFAAVGP